MRNLICKEIRYGPGDHTVLPATRTQTIPAFTPQPQSITAIWLVLIAPTCRGMGQAELSWVAGYILRDRLVLIWLEMIRLLIHCYHYLWIIAFNRLPSWASWWSWPLRWRASWDTSQRGQWFSVVLLSALLWHCSHCKEHTGCCNKVAPWNILQFFPQMACHLQCTILHTCLVIVYVQHLIVVNCLSCEWHIQVAITNEVCSFLKC